MSNDEGKNTKHVQDIFEQGKEFTREVLKENERLRYLNANLKNEIRDLNNQYVRVDVPRLQERVRLLEEENRLLREELQEIKKEYASIEDENWSFSERYLDVDRQNTTLMQLYVASQRLHTPTGLDDCVRRVKEIIVNMVGSEHFDIFLRTGDEFVSVGHEGAETPTGDVLLGTLRKVTDGGMTVVREDMENPASDSGDSGDGGDGGNGGDGPVAAFPLRVGDRVIGAVAVHGLLPQKSAIEPIDFQMFDLLGEHAGAAICGAFALEGSDIGVDDQAWADAVRSIAERDTPIT